MDRIKEALALVEALAKVTTPEEEFESRKNADGVIEGDGFLYEDVDEMISDMDDDSLTEAYGEYMDFVRAAKGIVSTPPEEKEDVTG